MDITLKQQELEINNKRKAAIFTVVLHALLLLLLLFMVNNIETPEPQQNEGIAIAFGAIDAGGDFEESVEEPVEEVNETEAVEEVQETQPTPTRAEPTPKPVQSSTNSDEIAINRKKEADAKAKADAVAKAKAEAERKRLEEIKKRNSTVFKKPSGGGTTPTNPGDPNSTIVDGGTGQGQTGSGVDMTGRTPTNRPAAPKNPGVKGNLVINICIDSKGNVISAESTQKGSTINDADIIKIAVSNAKKWKFNTDKNAPDKQCGSITYNFSIR